MSIGIKMPLIRGCTFPYLLPISGLLLARDVKTALHLCNVTADIACDNKVIDLSSLSRMAFILIAPDFLLD